MYHYFVVVLLCLFLPSCIKKSLSHNVKQLENEQVCHQANKQLDAIIKQEAMLIDIPIPLYDERIMTGVCDEIESDTLVFGYKSPLKFSQAVEFFITQMERYGWRHLISFDVYCKSILQFKSPGRYCTVVIEQCDNHALSSSIFIYIKRTSTDARS